MKGCKYICEDCNYSWGMQLRSLDDEVSDYEVMGDEMMEDNDSVGSKKYGDDLHNYAHSLDELERFEDIQSCPMCGSINIREL